jgi:hypothetical protein
MNIFVLIILKLFKNSTGRVVYKRGMCPTDFLFWFHVWWFFFVLFFKFSIGQKKNLRVWRRRCRHARISARSGNVYLLYLSTSGQLFVKNSLDLSHWQPLVFLSLCEPAECYVYIHWDAAAAAGPAAASNMQTTGATIQKSRANHKH